LLARVDLTLIIQDVFCIEVVGLGRIRKADRYVSALKKLMYPIFIKIGGRGNQIL